MDDRHSAANERERLQEAELLAPGLIHEMRHPLMGIKAGLQLVEMGLGDAVKSSPDWSLVKGQLARLEELFRNYQEFLHPGQASGSVFDVQPVVCRTVDLLGYRVRRLGARFELEVPECPVYAWGTPAALSHALTNLLANALDALEGTGDEGRLALRLLRSQGGVQVRVSDSGTGIAEAVAELIFDARFTTKPAGKGTGLGLTIARRMVGAYGGRVELVGTDDRDRLPWARTEFVVQLPDGAADRARPARPRPVASPAPAEPAARVLVVDDEPIILLLLRKTLKAAGLDAAFAADGDEAAALLLRERFDLLITDKNLPGTSGLELAAMARSRNAQIGVVLMTAYASRESAGEMFELGIDEYLPKPFETDYLTGRIQQILVRRRRAGRPAAAPHRVAIVEHDEPTCARLSQALKRLQLEPVSAADIASALRADPAPDALVASADLIGPAARAEIQKLQDERPGFQVVVVADEGSMSDTLTAISVGACARLQRTVEETALGEALQQALIGEAE